MSYAFQAEPRALSATPPGNGNATMTTTHANRTIYRNGASPKVKSNLMNDKRVIRGSTYAPRGLPSAAMLAQTLPRQPPISQPKSRSSTSKQHRGATTRDMSTATATATTSSISEVGRPITPEAVAGRHHMVTQTLEYREDLSQKGDA